jgi:phosphate transport system substrate-binding protein
MEGNKKRRMKAGRKAGIGKALVIAGTAALVVAAVATARAATNLTGAGATFPYPIYSKWFDEYGKTHPGVSVNYQAIGSGGGIRQVTARTVDFGATDGPMTAKQLFTVDGKILHIPTVMGAVVATYNLPGVAGLKLNGPLLADIFLGKIKGWNDPRITELNPGLALPDKPITVVHRSDGSGTTFCLVDYLCKVSREWEKKVGRGTAVNWPAGLGAKGNEGVAGLVKQTPGAIGYVELIYASQNNLGYATLMNRSGRFIEPTMESVSAAADGVTMPKDFRVSITDSSNQAAYPVSTFTWLLVYQGMPGEKGRAMRDLVKWVLADERQAMAGGLGYAPLPRSVRDMALAAAGKI